MTTLPDGSVTLLKRRRRNGPKNVARSSSEERKVLDVMDSDEEVKTSPLRAETKAEGSRRDRPSRASKLVRAAWRSGFRHFGGLPKSGREKPTVGSCSASDKAPEAAVLPSGPGPEPCKASKSRSTSVLDMLTASRRVASPGAAVSTLPKARTGRPKNGLRLYPGPSVALVIKKRWCDEILDGSKVWEIRGTPVARRGQVAIAQSRSKQLVGEANVVDCLKVGRRVAGRLVAWSKEEKDQRNFIGKKENLQYHCVEDLSWVKYSKVYAWVLEKRQRYVTPLPYTHPQGCITWVKLDAETSRRAHHALPRPFKAPLSLRPCVIDVP